MRKNDCQENFLFA